MSNIIHHNNTKFKRRIIKIRRRKLRSKLRKAA